MRKHGPHVKKLVNEKKLHVKKLVNEKKLHVKKPVGEMKQLQPYVRRNVKKHEDEKKHLKQG